LPLVLDLIFFFHTYSTIHSHILTFSNIRRGSFSFFLNAGFWCAEPIFELGHTFQQADVNVADPEPNPYVFGPPGSGSVSTRYGSGSVSFCQQAKIVRKTLIPTVL
jgi:hypothetical protein